MLEVPALMWQLDELMQEVDFVSVGSNDLFQFMMASDRGNARVSDRFDISASLSFGFCAISCALLAQQDVVDTVRRDGEQTLVGHGADRARFRSVSMTPTSIGPVKAMLLGLDAGLLAEDLNRALDDHTSIASVRDLLVAFAQANNIPV